MTLFSKVNQPGFKNFASPMGGLFVVIGPKTIVHAPFFVASFNGHSLSRRIVAFLLEKASTGKELKSRIKRGERTGKYFFFYWPRKDEN
jgi:hypothetical protein